ncbi:DUF6708 domain-containing protein [Paraburkholderia tropica]|uniref:DUF6708 domain-containing protein n=2 Tax=Paraburkholderia tropica TaxID=92647 RepID=UPI001FC83C5C|nr:DUF6708 domain-containing protein [Paraburkholderia tropica]
MAAEKPFLDRPVKGWTCDLGGPNDPPKGQLFANGEPPNHVDKTYLELHFATLWGRGVLMWLGLPLMLFALWMLPLVLDTDLSALLIGAGGVASCVWITALGLRSDVAPPRDEPIRFNRKRRKVYVYRFHYCWWNPFSRTRWGVRPVSFDWDDLRAESWGQIGIAAGGIAGAWGVDIAVVEPGTNHVIDRFRLAGSNTDGINLWAIARTYMQQGPDALPKWPYPPRDWNNDVGLNLARKLAPKVKWPAGMDIESRSAP